MPIQVIVYKLVFTTMCRMSVHSTLQRLFQSEPRYLCSFYLQQRKDFSVEKQKEEFDRATPHVLLVKEKYNYLHTTQKKTCVTKLPQGTTYKRRYYSFVSLKNFSLFGFFYFQVCQVLRLPDERQMMSSHSRKQQAAAAAASRFVCIEQLQQRHRQIQL